MNYPAKGRHVLTMSATVATAIGVAALLLAATSLAAAPAPAAAQSPTATPTRSLSTCVARPTKELWPPVVGLGATVDVRLTVSFRGCPGYVGPLHVVLVLDGSGSMASGGEEQLKKAARDLIDKLNMKDNPANEVGVVSFNSAAKVLCQLTNRASQALGCVDRVGASGGSCIDCGIKAGLGVMNRGRTNAADRDTIREVMIIVADGDNTSGCGPAMAAAGQTKGQQIILFTICAGPSCDAACFRAVASAPSHHFDVAPAGLWETFGRIHAEIIVQPLREVVVTDTLGADMLLVPGSASAPGAAVTDGRSVVWRLANAPTMPTELQLTLRVPNVAGTYPTNASAVGTFVDALGATGAFTFPLPTVRVDPNAPPPVPWPTATPIGAGLRPTATPAPGIGDAAPCPRLMNRLPRAAIDAALADPTRVGGWGVPCRVGQPVGPMNPLRRWLDLRNANLPWHPVFNGVVFKCGCG
ncbi:MAG: vWA domain-containing protein [Ardenticatenales bacterium]